MRPQWIVPVISILAITMANVSHGQDASPNSDKRTLGFQYLSPIDDDRDIETINVDYNSPIRRLDNLNLSVYLSITGTYANGGITQLEGDINQGTLREVHFDNSAFGLGPGLLLRFRLIEADKLSLGLIGRGNFIVYSERFPAGGEYYNFMWRGGAVINYALGHSTSLGFSYERSHVSNGQGLTSKNPSYDAHGVALWFTGWI